MKARILVAFLAAGIGILVARVPPAQPRRIGPAEIYPDPLRTSGAANPQVTQRNIQDTICSRRWSTRLLRPPSAYTSRLKRRQLWEYGDTVQQARAELVNPRTGKVDTTWCVARSDNPACYEEGHLIPIEDGGDPTDPRTLWPSPSGCWSGPISCRSTSTRPWATRRSPRRSPSAGRAALPICRLDRGWPMHGGWG